MRATPTWAPGNSAGARPARQRGFTLVELLVVVALIAIGVALSSLALRDPAVTQIEREAERLAMLLEAARAEARSLGVAARWEPQTEGFRFVGLPQAVDLPRGWLADETAAEIVGARAVVLGPEPLIGAQRIILSLHAQRIAIATDGLAPFAIEPAPSQ